jgi:RimJ/RimL family protein N-acetyltransferase
MERPMKTHPTLTTERLILREFGLSDAPAVQRLAGDREVASTTLNIPHPYLDGMAEAWINTNQGLFERGEGVTFAITRRADGQLLGAIGMMDTNSPHVRAEMGYWIGVPYWGQGFCTEAGRALLAYGFDELGLNRIFARHLSRNPASGRVMQKLGMQYEGCQRQHVLKWGVFEDMKTYGILRSEYRRSGI